MSMRSVLAEADTQTREPEPNRLTPPKLSESRPAERTRPGQLSSRMIARAGSGRDDAAMGSRRAGYLWAIPIIAGCGGLGPTDDSDIGPNTLRVATDHLADAVVDRPYAAVLEATGGTVSWSIVDGGLPPGPVLRVGGFLDGTPNQAGDFRFTVRAEAGSQVAFKALALAVRQGEVTAAFGGRFVLIPAGAFVMGSPNRAMDERPSHPVTISSSFMMQTTEVTQAEWRAVLGTSPSYFAACGPTCPVEQVSWDDAQAFVDRLIAMDPGKGYRLPTEAEWEYAARAGTVGDYGGTGIPAEMGWYYQNSSQTPHPVGGKAPNGWGLYDMHGNVSEWVQDYYGDGYYAVSPRLDPRGPATGAFRVVRGGSWLANTVDARSAARFQAVPGDRFDSVGLRLVRDP